MIAFSIVFLVCAGLWLMLVAIKYLAQSIDNAAAEKEKAEVSASPQGSATAGVSNIVAYSEDEGELVAVITAAIASMAGSDFRILDIQPTAAIALRPATSMWKMSGRIQNNEGLF
jgi:Na+-transporting methylmalonyl-CoA/oxaloacetate decarboxylase gamma subunit